MPREEAQEHLRFIDDGILDNTLRKIPLVHKMEQVL